MARGGARQGTPGVAYPNRTDLNPVKPLAPTAATGQTYGAAGAQLASQRAVPMGPPPPPAPAGPPTLGQPPQIAPDPGSFPPVTRPTERPDEHVMAGSPQGPGPGPEVLNLPSTPGGNLSDIISAAAATSGSNDLAFLAAQAKKYGQ